MIQGQSWTGPERGQDATSGASAFHTLEVDDAPADLHQLALGDVVTRRRTCAIRR
jgi:hypothetical protein